MRIPRPIKPGDTIGVCAPSSGVTGEKFLKRIEYSESIFNEFGFNIKETESVGKNSKCTSNKPEKRLEEFMTLYKDDLVGAIIPPWGGEFLMEMLPIMDFEEISSLPPKWVMGFSDISLLLFVLTLKADMITVHGPNLLDFASRDESVISVIDFLKNPEEIIKQKNLDYYQKNWPELSEDGHNPYKKTEKVYWKTIKNSTVEMSGKLIGGCLDVLISVFGTPYAPVADFIKKNKEEGIIWFLESCEMNASDIYRALWRMKESGFFNNCNGILYGRTEGYSDTGDFTKVDAFERISKELKIPIIYDADIGHLPPQITLFNGAHAEIKTYGGKGEIIQRL